MVAIGGPTLLTIFLAHRQYRDGINKRIAVMDKAHRETIEALAVAINTKDEVPLGVGEVTAGPTAAAIGNAVSHALGARIRDLPLTRERIMASLLKA